MTEEQAKTTRCCGPEGCGELQEEGRYLAFTRLCIGSSCMAWRPTFVIIWNVGAETTGGYCGLAGAP